MTLIRELLTWITNQAATLDEIWSRKTLWQYHRAIKEEIKEMETAALAGDIGKERYHMRRVQGYVLTCLRMIKEGRA